jgi:hypothetical protein
MTAHWYGLISALSKTWRGKASLRDPIKLEVGILMLNKVSRRNKRH